MHDGQGRGRLRRHAGRGPWRRGATAGASAVGAVVTAWAVLFVTIAVALAVPAIAHLRLPVTARVSMTRPVERFAPLSERFIGAVLGSVLPRPAEPGAAPAVPPAAPVPRPVRADVAGGAVTGPPPARAASVRHGFDNDAFSSAFEVHGLPFRGRTDTRSATREPGEPASCSVTGGTAWYRYVPDADRAVYANTFGSNYPIALAAYSGDDLSTLRTLGCDTGPTGNAHLALRLRAGESVFFQVTGLARGGDLLFSLERVGVTTLASLSSEGERGDVDSGAPVLSGDGRYIAFQSRARNLDPQRRDPRQVCKEWSTFCSHVFVHDRVTRTTELVSRSSSGAAGDSSSYYPSISADGRYVAFVSYATNLVPGDTNGVPDIFVFDRVTGTTTRESVSSSGAQADAATPLSAALYGSAFPSLSADGRYLSFTSDAENLVPGRRCDHARERGSCWQIYLRDRVARTTTLVSVSADGSAAAEEPRRSAISGNGRRVAFTSDGESLVPGAQRGCARQDDGRCKHLYVHDVESGTTTLVDVGPSGPGNGSVDGYAVAISGDGAFVSFASDASNLVADDTNEALDVFVADLASGEVKRVSVTSAGEERARPGATGYDESDGVFRIVVRTTTALSADGRYVAFESVHPLVAGDKNGLLDVFVHDQHTGATTQVSVSSEGEGGERGSNEPSMSADGRVVAFVSNDDFEGSGTEGRHVWVHERADGALP